MENQKDKTIEHDMDTWGIYTGLGCRLRSGFGLVVSGQCRNGRHGNY